MRHETRRTTLTFAQRIKCWGLLILTDWTSQMVCFRISIEISYIAIVFERVRINRVRGRRREGQPGRQRMSMVIPWTSVLFSIYFGRLLSMHQVGSCKFNSAECCQQGRWKVQLAVIQLSASCNSDKWNRCWLLAAAGSFIISLFRSLALCGSMSIGEFP